MVQNGQTKVKKKGNHDLPIFWMPADAVIRLGVIKQNYTLAQQLAVSSLIYILLLKKLNIIMVLASKNNLDLIWNPKELFKQSLENTCLILKIVHFF
jgi:hypothetical protein